MRDTRAVSSRVFVRMDHESKKEPPSLIVDTRCLLHTHSHIHTQRHKLTKNSARLVIALVGLPARGKSFVARKIVAYMRWSGAACEIFNVGRYRRQAYAEQQQQQQQTKQIGNSSSRNSTSDNDHVTLRHMSGACDANFFDATNQEAAALREHVAFLALQDMLRWLDCDDDNDNADTDGNSTTPINERCLEENNKEDCVFDEMNTSQRSFRQDSSRHSSGDASSLLGGGVGKFNFFQQGKVAIFDATNSTNKRRQWILEQCTSPELRGDNHQTGVVFVESVCDDQELINENYRYKVSNSPDFEGMLPEEALADLRQRVEKYEAQYETVDDDSLSYIKVFNLSTKLLVNHIYGRLAKDLVPALMAWHIGTRPVFLCRPGQTMSGILTDGEDYVAHSKMDHSELFREMSVGSRRRSMRGDSLGPQGELFREKLLDFCHDEVHSFMLRRASVRDMAKTGTSISGLAPASVNSVHNAQGKNKSAIQSNIKEPFPLQIMTSTMPRAVDTVSWPEFELPVHQLSSLNPLDKGVSQSVATCCGRMIAQARVGILRMCVDLTVCVFAMSLADRTLPEWNWTRSRNPTLSGTKSLSGTLLKQGTVCIEFDKECCCLTELMVGSCVLGWDEARASIDDNDDDDSPQ
jgi:hypothetical protein